MSDEQEWEKLRRAVNAPEITSTEWRINTLERRFNVLEMSMVKQLEQDALVESLPAKPRRSSRVQGKSP